MSGRQHDAGGADEVERCAEGEDTSSVGPPVRCLDEPPESLIVQVARSVDTLCDLQAAGKAIGRENAELKEAFNRYDQAVKLVYQGCKASPEYMVQAAELKDKMASVPWEAAAFAEVSAQNRIQDLCRSKTAELRRKAALMEAADRKAAIMEAAEVEAKAVWMAEEARVCIICEEAPREVRFACGHATVCKNCLPDILKKHRKCPMCNVAFGAQPVAEHGAHVRTAPTFVLPR